MKLIIYSKIIRNVSGVQTFELAFLQEFYKDFDITVVYEAGDKEKIEQFSKYAQMSENHGQTFEADICIFSSIYSDNPKILAEKYYQVCHMDFYAWRVKYTPKPNFIHIAVSNTVKESLKAHYNIESIVIPNLLPKQEIKRVLRLMTASRIDQGKGFDRMVTLAQKLKDDNRDFIWEIYGTGSQMMESIYREKMKNFPIHFMGHKSNIQSYMKVYDFVVQLSDSEGFCYSVHESLNLGTPVIVTRWDGVEETVIDGVNGFILEKDLSNLDIERVYSSRLSNIPYYVKNVRQTWLDLLS